MNNLLLKWLAALFFTLFSLSCLSVPLSVMADKSTIPEPPDEPSEEEPECD